MRAAIALAIMMLGSASVFAAPLEALYYVGEVKLSAATGQPIGSQVILLEKIHDRGKATIIEHAIVVQPDGKAEERTMRLAVKDDNTFSLTDDANTIKGSGTLFGPAWKWTYFKGTFKAQNGVMVEDENFMADDAAITARKKVTGPDNQIIMYMEMTLKSITPKTFEILRLGVQKK
jgi:hypothetical protein